AGPLDFDAWVHGLRDGRSYVSDGASHLLDFAVGGVEGGAAGGSRPDLEQKGTGRLTARVAARPPGPPAPEIRGRQLSQKPHSHLERARLGDSRRVPVEVVVNGRAVARQEIDADGAIRPVAFAVPVERSSWIALRIYPSSHTNPVFVHVGGAPVR